MSDEVKEFPVRHDFKAFPHSHPSDRECPACSPDDKDAMRMISRPADTDKAERRRYALLQAAAVLSAAASLPCKMAVDEAAELLAEIERREGEPE